MESNGKIKNLKINAKVIAKAIPYMVLTGLSLVGVPKVAKSDFPLKKDAMIKAIPSVITETDSNGNVRREKAYTTLQSFAFNRSTLDDEFYYVSKWNKNESGEYTRTVNQYSTKDLKKLVLEKYGLDYQQLFDRFNDLDMEVFGNFLNTPQMTITETRSNLSEEDFLEAAHLKVVSYDYDNNDVTFVKMDATDKSIVLFSMMVVAFGSYGTWYFGSSLAKQVKMLIKEKKEKDINKNK